ncbi:hypothetical protein AB0I60_00615 [Actinosynnema sp. NPDC050436]|uniref:hypothetical protein n=1 Tax=Actinosynnema sp. NPDC050436 TaxID=3155659 RepID=UPI00340C13D0
MDRDSVAALFEEAVDRAAAGEHGAVVSWTSGEDRWVQVTWDAVNLAYPHGRSPEEVLAGIALPEYVTLRGWEAGSYVTFDHGAHDTTVLADFVVACTERLWRPAA